MIRLSPNLEAYITATASTVKVHRQNQFLMSVKDILKACPQKTISWNDCVMACKIALRAIPNGDIRISNGGTDDEDYEVHKRL